MADQQLLTVSVSPHIHSPETVSSIMHNVGISLIPSAVVSIYFFGIPAVVTIFTSVGFCLLSEYVSRKIMKRENTLADGSAVVTGLLLAFVLPPTLPWWITAIGAMTAIVLGKQVFGGLGHNLFNPALVSRAVLLASWPVEMTTWVQPYSGITSASPLAIVKMNLPVQLPSYWQMFIGNRAGSLGETSALFLLLGAGYLIYKKVISWHIPGSYILAVFIISALTKRDPVFDVLAGGLVIGAFFMATDYVTSPMTKKGKLIFGTGCGLMTMLIRLQGGFPEGVCYAILIMNMIVPFIDKWTTPRVFGWRKSK